LCVGWLWLSILGFTPDEVVHKPYVAIYNLVVLAQKICVPGLTRLLPSL
jgi:hypothetical protein